jgi:hypothetical protein
MPRAGKPRLPKISTQLPTRLATSEAATATNAIQGRWTPLKKPLRPMQTTDGPIDHRAIWV